MKEYPRILNMLCLYVTAGVTVRKAMQRMVMDDEREKEKEKKAGMELFYKAVRELDSGVNEMEVYRRIGERSGNRQYRKLSLLLMQDLKKGNRQSAAAVGAGSGGSLRRGEDASES